MRQRYIFWMQALCVGFCVRCIYELRLAGWDWESEMKHPKFQPRLSIFPSPCPWQNVADVFSRIRKKMISNKSFGIILDEWDHISPSPEIIRVILREVSHHQTRIYWRSHICFCHTPKLFEASQLRKASIKIGSCKPAHFWSKQGAKRSWRFPKRVI